MGTTYMHVQGILVIKGACAASLWAAVVLRLHFFFLSGASTIQLLCVKGPPPWGRDGHSEGGHAQLGDVHLQKSFLKIRVRKELDQIPVHCLHKGGRIVDGTQGCKISLCPGEPREAAVLGRPSWPRGPSTHARQQETRGLSPSRGSPNRPAHRAHHHHASAGPHVVDMSA